MLPHTLPARPRLWVHVSQSPAVSHPCGCLRPHCGLGPQPSLPPPVTLSPPGASHPVLPQVSPKDSQYWHPNQRRRPLSCLVLPRKAAGAHPSAPPASLRGQPSPASPAGLAHVLAPLGTRASCCRPEAWSPPPHCRPCWGPPDPGSWPRSQGTLGSASRGCPLSAHFQPRALQPPALRPRVVGTSQGVACLQWDSAPGGRSGGGGHIHCGLRESRPGLGAGPHGVQEQQVNEPNFRLFPSAPARARLPNPSLPSLPRLSAEGTPGGCAPNHLIQGPTARAQPLGPTECSPCTPLVTSHYRTRSPDVWAGATLGTKALGGNWGRAPLGAPEPWGLLFAWGSASETLSPRVSLFSGTQRTREYFKEDNLCTLQTQALPYLLPLNLILGLGRPETGSPSYLPSSTLLHVHRGHTAWARQESQLLMECTTAPSLALLLWASRKPS